MIYFGEVMVMNRILGLSLARQWCVLVVEIVLCVYVCMCVYGGGVGVCSEVSVCIQ